MGEDPGNTFGVDMRWIWAEEGGVWDVGGSAYCK